MNNEEKKIEVMPIGKVTLKDGTKIRINERNDIEIDEEKLVAYRNFKENKKHNQKIPAKKSNKKSISKKTFLAGVVGVFMLTYVNHAMSIGTQNIVNDINNNLAPSNVTSYDTSTGFKFMQSNPDGMTVEIDGEKYTTELCEKGIKTGYTQEQMAIYCKYIYGTDHGLSQGLVEEIQTKIESYKNFRAGQELIEKNEIGRSSR